MAALVFDWSLYDCAFWFSERGVPIFRPRKTFENQNVKPEIMILELHASYCLDTDP